MASIILYDCGIWIPWWSSSERGNRKCCQSSWPFLILRLVISVWPYWNFHMFENMNKTKQSIIYGRYFEQASTCKIEKKITSIGTEQIHKWSPWCSGNIFFISKWRSVELYVCEQTNMAMSRLSARGTRLWHMTICVISILRLCTNLICSLSNEVEMMSPAW